MSKTESSPTMIIPNGTEIQIDVHGQLSVRTPGNLVIQNSGHYGEIESVGGSIRIEANAEVEAVSVRCADTCYVQGSLTAWKVKARGIHLEEKAQARIVLQETEGIEIGRNAQLVGNFASEKELFLLFSRFAQQLRSLPFYFDRKGDGPGQLADPVPPPAPQELREPPMAPTAPITTPPPAAAGEAANGVDVSPLSNRMLEAGRELPDQLFFAYVRLERASKSETYGMTSRRVLEELVKLLKNRDLETLQHTYRTLFSRIVEPGDDILRAQEMIESYCNESLAEPVVAEPHGNV